MAGETETTTTSETTETTAQETTQVAPETKPHPLAEGGERFKEVYRNWKESERRERELAERLSRVESAQALPKPAPTQQFYTHDQLQAGVDAGRITAAQMAAQLAWQAKEEAKREIRSEFQTDARHTAANSEIWAYMDKIPALNVKDSPEHLRVERAAREIAHELDRTLNDPVVQKMALRQVYGPLDKVASAEKAREYDRQHADTHTDTSAGGGSADGRKPDPLKAAPPALKAHWDRMGYTTEQRVAEMKYVNLDRWRRRSA